jgi:hypothetical protein
VTEVVGHKVQAPEPEDLIGVEAWDDPELTPSSVGELETPEADGATESAAVGTKVEDRQRAIT